jgi:glycosyltransferase involved in cell wall biosynthesis
MPAVTVLLSVFNQDAYLADAIDSALGQTYRDFEVLIVDNGSTDTTPDIAATHVDGDRVRLMRFAENGPITARWNAAVRQARGRYVAFLFGDDLFLPNKLEIQVPFLEASPDVGVVYGPYLGENVMTGARWHVRALRADGEPFRDLMRKHDHGAIQMPPALFRREALVRHPFHEDLFSEGEAIFWRIALTHRFVHVDEATAVMRDHDHNMGKALGRNVEMIQASLEHLRRDPALPLDYAPLVDRFEGRLLVGCAWQAARLDLDSAWVLRWLREAVLVDRRQALRPRAYAAAALSLLPRTARRFANRIGHRIRRQPYNVMATADYDRPVDTSPETAALSAEQRFTGSRPR